MFLYDLFNVYSRRRLGNPSGLFPLDFSLELCVCVCVCVYIYILYIYIYNILHTHISRQFVSPWFLVHYIWRVQIMNHVIKQSRLPSITPFPLHPPLRSKCLPQRPVLETVAPKSKLNKTGNVRIT
jgi:hypothetical protein